MMSAFSSRAVSRNLLRGHHGHPDSRPSKLLHWEHDCDDVLADVVHVALTVATTILPLALVSPEACFSASIVGHRCGDGLFRRAQTYHLRQNILPAPEQVATCSCRPSAAFDHLDGPPRSSAAPPRWLHHVGRDAVHESVREPGRDRFAPPREVFFPSPSADFTVSANFTSRSGGIGPAVEDHVSTRSSSLSDVVVHADLARVDDAHRHAAWTAW